MELTLVAGGDETGCAGKHCPAVYLTDRGTVVVQGYVVTDAVDVDIPEGETMVEVPSSLLTSAVVDPS